MSETFGKYLTQQRELRALSRDEVAKATRIALPHLAALEEDRLDDLPGEAFVLGFIRSYADAIGLNTDDAVLRFQEQRPAEQRPDPKPAAAKARLRRTRWLWLVLLALGLAIGFLFARR